MKKISNFIMINIIKNIDRIIMFSHTISNILFRTVGILKNFILKYINNFT